MEVSGEVPGVEAALGGERWRFWSLVWALAPSLNVHSSLVRLFCSLQGISAPSMRSCGAGGDTEWDRR